ncbi:MAG: phosphate acetyltransferase [Oscillospiraceae bacterium]
MFAEMAEKLKKNPKIIVFPEGDDVRILHAVSRLKKEGVLIPLLLGNVSEIRAIVGEERIDIDGIEVIDPKTYADIDKMVAEMVEIRKGKMSEEECRAALKKRNYFGTMLVKMGMAAGLLGGATYSTADTVRPALQIIKTKPGNKIVSSCFLLVHQKETAERYIMADCAINISPNEDELVEITVEAANMAKCLGIEPRVALLSYSTKGSAEGDSINTIRGALKKLLAMGVDFPVDGELQFDSAFVPAVAEAKAPNSPIAGRANTFIFPDLNAGNIGYKMAQRFGGFEAVGPMLLGINQPINDLSRGTNTDEIYKMAILTALSAN